MQARYLIGVDIGTSGVKTLLCDLAGRRIAQHRHTYTTLAPHPGFVEQDADTTWWRGALAGIKACLSQSGINPAELAGICASGMVPNLCPLDKDGNTVRPAILYRDNRAVLQVQRLKQRFDWNFTLQDVAPKLLWIKENEPHNYQRIETVLNSHSYIAYKLTGKLSADHDIAAIFGEVYDEENKVWMPERMKEIGLKPSVLPPLYQPTDILGGVTAEAAEETGLLEGTPVVVGTGDSFTILVGTGTVDADEGLIYLGTAGTFLGLHDSLDNLHGKLPFVTGEAGFLANVLTGGEITQWFTKSVLCGKTLNYQELEEAAAKVSLGSEHLFALPHLLGERTPVADPLAKGVLFGLTNAHTAGHMYRAFLEGVAFSLRESYEHNHMPLRRLVIGGGGSNCLLWRQIIADVLGLELQAIENGDNALGTAFLAARGLGLVQSYQLVRDEWLCEYERITPIAENVERYNEVYAFYKKISDRMRPAYQELAELVYTQKAQVERAQSQEKCV